MYEELEGQVVQAQVVCTHGLAFYEALVGAAVCASRILFLLPEPKVDEYLQVSLGLGNVRRVERIPSPPPP